MTNQITELRQITDRLATLADEIHDEENENKRAASASLRKAGWLVEDAVDSLRRESPAVIPICKFTVERKAA